MPHAIAVRLVLSGLILLSGVALAEARGKKYCQRWAKEQANRSVEFRAERGARVIGGAAAGTVGGAVVGSLAGGDDGAELGALLGAGIGTVFARLTYAKQWNRVYRQAFAECRALPRPPHGGPALKPPSLPCGGAGNPAPAGQPGRLPPAGLHDAEPAGSPVPNGAGHPRSAC